MKIELSQEQYLTLAKLLQLANWPLGLTAAGEELARKAEGLEQYILSLADDFSLRDQVFFDREEECYHLVERLKEKVELIIDEYEEYVFWDQLTHKLATIDLKKQIKMDSTIDEKINRMFQLKEQYEKYFLKNGLENLTIF
ncbi:hypothetical protein [Bacillus sp. REN3]|uniref:hypothetical protein n=1 Tax=Bacillus sp. REN3 TaxID=2802440 RepID=UPI001AEE0DC5|nr:hypothetical protein [Bacillus sp. REN3]